MATQRPGLYTLTGDPPDAARCAQRRAASAGPRRDGRRVRRRGTVVPLNDNGK